MIVAFGTYDAGRHPRVGVLIEGLRARGEEVIEINRPLGLTTRERVRMLREPWRLPALALRLGRRWWDLRVEVRMAQRTGLEPSVVIVGYLGHFDVFLARWLFPRAEIVLDHLVFAADTAQDRGESGLRVRLLRALDRRAIATANLIVVDTPEHFAMLPANAEGIVVRVGALDEWYAVAREAEALNAVPSIVFFGAFTPLQGAPILAQALARVLDVAPQTTVTLIGTGQDWGRAREILAGRDSVRWIDWIEPENLPTVVAAHDISLGIFATSPKALRVVPNKVYEAAAAGCAVITSDTPPQRGVLGDGAIFTAPGDSGALADAILGLVTSRDRLADARRVARHRAQTFRPERVVDVLLDALSART